MDINQAVAELVQREGGVCIFDKIAFPLPYNTDAVACKFGLGAELYMSPCDQLLLRQRALDLRQSASAKPAWKRCGMASP